MLDGGTALHERLILGSGSSKKSSGEGALGAFSVNLATSSALRPKDMSVGPVVPGRTGHLQ